MKRISKIALISGIIAIVIIAAALTVHYRLSETEKSEISSGSEQNEKESASQVVNEIVNSLQNKPNSESNENSEQSETTEQNEGAEQTSVIGGQTEISIKQVDGVYRWSNYTTINPVIILKVNMKNYLHFTNPTDTKHSFVIEHNGTTFLATKDLEAGLSGNISIKPNSVGIFEYHCKYHPDTMKGILNVEP